jgi:hypothetical protein
MGGARQGRRERSYWLKYGRDRGRRLAAIQRGPAALLLIRQALRNQADFFAPLSREEVDPVDEAHPVVARAHDERMRAGAVGKETNAAKEIAVRDSGGSDDHLTGSEVIGGEDLADVVDSGLRRLRDLAARRGPELSL